MVDILRAEMRRTSEHHDIVYRVMRSQRIELYVLCEAHEEEITVEFEDCSAEQRLFVSVVIRVIRSTAECSIKQRKMF